MKSYQAGKSVTCHFTVLLLFMSCKQYHVPSISIGQVSAIFYLKSIGIGLVGENWYWYITKIQLLSYLGVACTDMYGCHNLYRSG